MILLVGLLSCSAPEPPPTPPAPVPEPAPEAEAPPVSDPELAEALEKVRRQVGLAARSEADACAAAAQVLAVWPRLDEHLSQRLSNDPEALRAALPELTERLPGFKVELAAEVVHVIPDWPELSRAAQDEAASGALISAGAWLTPRPVWARPVTDITVCADHKAARPWLERLAPTLERGPSCLQDVLRPGLQEALRAFVTQPCLCAPEAEARAAAAQTGRTLRRLSILDGPALADQLEQTLATATFDGACGG